MEISKGLQEEIIAVQNKLKNAIRDHQICVGKLKDDSNNTDILGQIQEIQLHIVSLGRCQKQIVQRLRKEVDAFKAENANGAKVSVASLLGLNNNNHITNNNEADRTEAESNGLDQRISKDDYEEEVVRNGDVSSPTQDHAASKGRPSSVETISGEDDVIEVSVDENSCEKQEEQEEEWKVESPEKLTFLNGLGLITTLRYTELQNKRAERKRRSTANPQFVYSSLELPTKRKRHSYLQSAGNAPQTRQTTARMNGPSPPPSKVSPPKSTSPPTKTASKSLIPLQKSTTRPNILRNAGESKVYVGKSKLENGAGHTQVQNTKPINSKTVHIPGLPSSLTIERIESDSIVCINCRNPGILTVCEKCSASYHVSCHSISPAPPRTCPKCALKDSEDGLPGKRDEELASATYTSGAAGKAGEDAEIHKTSRGLYKTDATAKKHLLTSSLGIGQLPSSTFLIPITSSPVPGSTVEQPDVLAVASCTSGNLRSETNVSYSPVVLGQLPTVAYAQSEPQMSYAYQLNSNVHGQAEKHHQSYLIVKKLSDPSGSQQLYGQSHGGGSQGERQGFTSILGRQLPSAGGSEYDSPFVRRVSEFAQGNSSSLLVGRRFSEPIPRGRKKSNRAVPALNRIFDPANIPVTTRDCQLERATYNGRGPKVKQQQQEQQRAKLGGNQLRSSRATEILLPAYDVSNEPADERLEISEQHSEPAQPPAGLAGRSKQRTKSAGLLHSLFAGYNKSHSFADRLRESQGDCADGKADPANLRWQQQRRDNNRPVEPDEQPDEPAVHLQRGAISKFFEHVKLEEAHLSAPPGTELAEIKRIDDSENKDSTLDRDFVEALEDEDLADDGDDDSVDAERQGSFTLSKWQQKTWQSSEVSPKDQVEERAVNSQAKTEEDFEVFEEKHGDLYERLDREESNEENEASSIDSVEGETSHSRRFASDDDGNSNEVTAQSNLLELLSEVSVPHDKADTERQDLDDGRRSTSTDSDAHEQKVKDDEDTKETAAGSTKSEEPADSDDGDSEGQRDFEHATLNVDRGNTAAC